MFLTWCFCFCSLLWAQEEVVAPDSTVMTAQDSLAVLLAEPPLDSLIFAYADSLFLPQSGRARIVRDDYGVPHITAETEAAVANPALRGERGFGTPTVTVDGALADFGDGNWLQDAIGA